MNRARLVSPLEPRSRLRMRSSFYGVKRLGSGRNERRTVLLVERSIASNEVVDPAGVGRITRELLEATEEGLGFSLARAVDGEGVFLATRLCHAGWGEKALDWEKRGLLVKER